jgi:hypothetical protein
MKIFISYRRDGSSDIVGRLRDHLAPEFGEENIFVDVYSIELGADFRQVIRQSLQEIDAVILVIGPTFNPKRLFEPGDSLCMEIEEVLESGTLLLPVLHGGARMVAGAALPPSLQRLSDLNAGQLRSDPDFQRDAAALVDRLRDPGSDGRRDSEWARTGHRMSQALLSTRGFAAVAMAVGLLAFALVAWPAKSVSAKSLLGPHATWIADDELLRKHVKKLDCRPGRWLAQLESDQYSESARSSIQALVIAFPDAKVIDTAMSCPGLRPPYDRILVGIGPYASRDAAVAACDGLHRGPDECFSNEVMDAYEKVTVGNNCPRKEGGVVILAGLTNKSRVFACRTAADSPQYFIVRFDRMTGDTSFYPAERQPDASLSSINGSTEVTLSATLFTLSLGSKAADSGGYTTVTGAI